MHALSLNVVALLWVFAAITYTHSAAYGETLYLQCDTTERIQITQQNKLVEDDTYHWRYRLTIFDQKTYILVNETNANVSEEGTVVITPRDYILKRSNTKQKLVLFENTLINRETGHFVSNVSFSSPAFDLNTSIADEGSCQKVTATPKF